MFKKTKRAISSIRRIIGSIQREQGHLFGRMDDIETEIKRVKERVVERTERQNRWLEDLEQKIQEVEERLKDVRSIEEDRWNAIKEYLKVSEHHEPKYVFDIYQNGEKQYTLSDGYKLNLKKDGQANKNKTKKGQSGPKKKRT